MKREYTAPEAEIEKFILSTNEVFTTSSGFDDGGDTGEEVDW